MEDLNKYRIILYKKCRENTIMIEDTDVKDVIIESSCNYYIIIIPIQNTKRRTIGITRLPYREYITMLN